MLQAPLQEIDSTMHETEQDYCLEFRRSSLLIRFQRSLSASSADLACVPDSQILIVISGNVLDMGLRIRVNRITKSVRVVQNDYDGTRTCTLSHLQQH
ncbi:hypothetical protein OsccyDRAFT_4803 [Leptolyngbyaceae cyanobacterium JSC-12]|nr:hypothetical protein OsccyDRAFT_4803 [Leptolyngbyaceae cyanobacterium JSC-12]